MEKCVTRVRPYHINSFKPFVWSHIAFRVFTLTKWIWMCVSFWFKCFVCFIFAHITNFQLQKKKNEKKKKWKILQNTWTLYFICFRNRYYFTIIFARKLWVIDSDETEPRSYEHTKALFDSIGSMRCVYVY